MSSVTGKHVPAAEHACARCPDQTGAQHICDTKTSPKAVWSLRLPAIHSNPCGAHTHAARLNKKCHPEKTDLILYQTHCPGSRPCKALAVSAHLRTESEAWTKNKNCRQSQKKRESILPDSKLAFAASQFSSISTAFLRCLGTRLICTTVEKWNENVLVHRFRQGDRRHEGESVTTSAACFPLDGTPL